ncbi:MAG: pilus assembly protein [Betaproteobacteria bacterium]|nr:MAG: pilus assembly protein [Betaproteobacteria bacterium]
MTATIIVAALAFGLTASLLAWMAIEIGNAVFVRYRERFTEQAGFNLRELFLFIDPTRLFLLNLAVAILLGAGMWLVTDAALWGLLGAALTGLTPRIVFALLRRRRLERIEEQMPDALLVIAGGLRAGLSLMLVLQQLVREGRPPIAQEFELLVREQRLGVPVDDALDNLARRIPLQCVTLVVSAMRIANETGGSLAEALERAALTIRSQLAMEAKIRALTAQGKLQAIVVGLLPVGLMLVLGRMEPQAMALMWTTPLGWATLGTIALLELFGVLLIRRLLAVDV